MKKLRLFTIFLCLMFLLQSAVVPVFAETEPQDTTVPETLDATQPAPDDPTIPVTDEELPDYSGADASIVGGSRTIEAMSSLQGGQRILNTAKSAILYEMNSDTIVYSWLPDERVAPGGLAKLMTCLLALENTDIEEVITVDASVFSDIDYISNAAYTYRFHSMALLDGEEIRIKDLIYGMIVWNANDAAAVLANHIAGSTSAFVDMMNERAKSIGCRDTQFVNPHGIDAEGQYTTARDIARILKDANRHEAFRKVLSSDFWDVNETNMSAYRGFMYGDNYMCGMLISDLYYEDRVVGGKVAENADGQRSFACIAEEGDLTYAIVVLETTPKMDEGEVAVGGNMEFVETQQLVDIAFEGYEIKQVLRPGQITSRFKVNNGANDVAAGPDREIVTLLPTGLKLDDLTLRYQKTSGSLDAPVEKGKKIDTMTVWLGNVCVAQADLITMNGSEVAQTTVGNAPMGSGGGSGVGLTIFLVIVGLIVAFAAVLYIIKFVRTGMLRRRSRRRRESRRRT